MSFYDHSTSVIASGDPPPDAPTVERAPQRRFASPAYPALLRSCLPPLSTPLPFAHGRVESHHMHEPLSFVALARTPWPPNQLVSQLQQPVYAMTGGMSMNLQESLHGCTGREISSRPKGELMLIEHQPPICMALSL